MKTYEIKRSTLKGMEPIAVGYKAVNYNGTTMHGYAYGKKDENLVGRIFEVTGDIQECKWGLHFSKDPANVFNFYKPLGYNRYFKVNAYGTVTDSDDGLKSVAQIIEFVEEYDIIQYIDIVKKYDRSTVSCSNAVIGSDAVNCSNAVSGSNAVGWSNAVSGSYAVDCSYAVGESYAVSESNAVIGSKAVNCSNAVSGSNAVDWSNAVSGSNAVDWSNAVSGSNAVDWSNAVRGSKAVNCSNAVSGSKAVSGSYGLRKCEAIKNGIFCYDFEGAKNVIFNKVVTEDRFNEVYKHIREFDYAPNWDNFYELKGNKEWYTIAFPELMRVDNKTAWSKMPKEMITYIKSLPEYDDKIFKAITQED